MGDSPAAIGIGIFGGSVSPVVEILIG